MPVDEIVDRPTGHRYPAITHAGTNDARPSENDALISSFAGPTGNRVVVIAGTRDAALTQVVDFVTRAEPLARLTAPLRGAPAFAVLLSVKTLHDVGLRARLLAASRRPREEDWSGRRTWQFPTRCLAIPRPRADAIRRRPDRVISAGHHRPSFGASFVHGR